MASIQDRSGRREAGRFPGEMLQAVFAFGTKADVGRAGKFDHNLPSGAVAEHDSRQGRGDAEQEMKSSGRKAENGAFQAWPPAVFHGIMIAPRGKRVKEHKKSGPFRGKARVRWTGNYLDPPRRSAIRIFLASRSVPIDRSNPDWETL
jgi:hypothetical protein